MLQDPKPDDIENWVCVMERGTEYEIEMAKDYLSNLEIPSNILSKRDSSFNLNVSDMAHVYLYVPNEYEAEAREALAEWDTPSDQADEQE
ncbi:MAG: hypothetical protein JXR26_01975 [Balneolaceae bacterium]|nr:hypothetical protein [Balneolaceae bacterium]